MNHIVDLYQDETNQWLWATDDLEVESEESFSTVKDAKSDARKVLGRKVTFNVTDEPGGS